MEPEQIKRIVKYAVIGLVIVILLFGAFGTIDAGERGVKTRFGAVVGVVDQGLYFKLPFIERVITMNVQTQKEQIDAEAASKDLQTVRTTMALNYNVQADKVGEIYTKISEDYKSRIIDPAIQEAVKAATAKYTAEELVTKRPIVRDEIKTILTARLQHEDIQVTEVSIVNFDFSESFNKAIEAKVTTEQNALAAKNKLEQVKYEADQRIAQAKGEAEAIKIQAQAITQQGGSDYVKLQWIKQWNGTLPTTMLGSNTPIIDLSK